MTGMTDLLWKLFVNRSDRYLIQSDVWNWSDSRLTKKIVGQHLEGNIRIGIAELDRESLTKFVLLDIDKHTPEAAERFDAVVDRLRKTVDSHRGTSFKNAIRFIHTGSGIHLIMFFNQKAPAKILKESFLFPLLEECGFRVEDSKWFDGDVQMGEIFPRQDTITIDGYAVRLPLGKHKNGEWSKVMFGQDLRSVITIRLGKKLLDTFKSDSKTREKKKYDPLPDWSTPKNKVALPGCIITLMDRKSVHDGTHQNNLDLGQALVVSGYSVDNIHTIFSGMRGYRYSVTQYQIQDTIKRIKKGILLPKTYRCETYTNDAHGLTCDAARCPRESHLTGVPPTNPIVPQWTKTPVSPFTQTICPDTVIEFSKDILPETMSGPKSTLFGKYYHPSGAYSFDELTLEDVVDTLELTIVYDETNKKVVLLCGVLNYTNEDQQNIGFSSGSSTGKSHICLEIAKLFPEEDVQKLGYASPQAFIHDFGILTNDAGLPLVTRDKFVSDNIEVWDEKNPRPEQRGEKTEWKENRTKETSRVKGIWNAIQKVYRVDLHQKILIFLDQPHDLLLTRLRALLSHDDKVIRAKITDKSSSGGHRTKAVDLVGFPSVWFLTTHFSPDEQERSRMVMLSAEITQEKIIASLDMVSKKLADRDAFRSNIDSNEKRNELKARIHAIKEAGIEEIIIADEDREKIITTFKEEHPYLAPRQQRDFPRLLAIIKGHALLNLFSRKREGNRVWTNETDIEAGKKLYAEIAESNELGLPPVIYGVWKDIIKPAFDMGEGIHAGAVAANYYRLYRERIGGKRLESMIGILIEVGLVIRISDPNDKRRVLLWSPDMEIPKPTLDTKEKTEAIAAKVGRPRRKKKKPSDPKTGPLQGDVRRKPLPREVKKFDRWLAKLPSAGQRGFNESDIKKTHGEGYLDGISKYEKKGWIEQRGSKPDQWWLSDTGKAALRGDA